MSSTQTRERQSVSPLPGRLVLVTIYQEKEENLQLAYKLLPGYNEDTAICKVETPAEIRESGWTTCQSLHLDLSCCAWACLRTTQWSGRMKMSYQYITDTQGQALISGGPLLDLQTFMEQNKIWVRANESAAINWLMMTCKRQKLKDIYISIKEAREAIGQKEMDQAWQKVARKLKVIATWPATWEGVISAPIRIAQEVQKEYQEEWQFCEQDIYHWGKGHPAYPEEKATDYCLLDASHGTIRVRIPDR